MIDADALLTLARRLASERQPGATLCPSELARAIDANDWRAQMPAVHAAVDALCAGGKVALSWKGAPMPRRDGPYRIRVK